VAVVSVAVGADLDGGGNVFVKFLTSLVLQRSSSSL